MPEFPEGLSPEAERHLRGMTHKQRSVRGYTRWSFGGAEAIETAVGVLYPRLLVARPSHAALHAVLTGFPEQARTEATEGVMDALGAATIHAVALTDAEGVPYDLHLETVTGNFAGRGRGRGPMSLRLAVSPVPPRELAWLELCGQAGSTARLRPSARLEVRVSPTVPAAGSSVEHELSQQALMLIGLHLAGVDGGAMERHCSSALARAAETQVSGESRDADTPADELARLCAVLTGHSPADELPSMWSTMLDAAGLADGPRLHLDISAALPSLADIAVQVDGILSEPGSWDLYLRAEPSWWTFSADRQRKRAVMSVYAKDNLGGRYLSQFGGSDSDGGHEEVVLTFRPRLNARAGALTLTFVAANEQVALELRLP
jgi:hypothetical protein